MTQFFFGPDGTPLLKPEDVIRFLGKQHQHWKEDRSAYQTAYSWIRGGGIPQRIRDILRTDPAFDGAILTRAIFENKTKLDTFGRESQTDLLAYLQTESGDALLGIEAKVDESFGPLVREWNDYGTGKLRRLAGLLDRLEFKSTRIGNLRYQLFHRVAATLIEAQEAGVCQAAMIVQSFDQARAGFDDLVAFADAFGTPLSGPGQFSQSKKLGTVTIRLGWTESPLWSAKGA